MLWKCRFNHNLTNRNARRHGYTSFQLCSYRFLLDIPSIQNNFSLHSTRIERFVISLCFPEMFFPFETNWHCAQRLVWALYFYDEKKMVDLRMTDLKKRFCSIFGIYSFDRILQVRNCKSKVNTMTNLRNETNDSKILLINSRLQCALPSHMHTLGYLFPTGCVFVLRFNQRGEFWLTMSARIQS